MRGLSLVASSGGYSSLHCAGFSLQWLLSLQSTGFRARSFSSCGMQALVAGHRFSCLPRMYVLPGPGIKPVSPALADGFLTPGPPGKSYLDDFPVKPAQFCPQRPACMTQRKHITRRECFVIILLYIVIARDEAHRLASSIHLISATPPENFHCRNAPSADFLLSGSNYCPVDPVINN